MKLADVNPYIRFACNQILEMTDRISCSYDCRLMYIVRGELAITRGARQALLREGSMAIWQSDVPYRLYSNRGCEVLTLNFDLTQAYSSVTHSLAVVTPEEYEPEKLHGPCVIDDCPELSELIVCPNARQIEPELSKLTRRFGECKRFYGEWVSSVLKLIICEAVCGALDDGSSRTTVERVIEYIRDNYRQPITNRDISESVNYHEYYVNRLMRSQTGMTLHQYLLDYRLRSAESLLLTTDYPVAKISELCGFMSDAYFISAFRHRAGETPNEYRRRRRGLI